MLKRNLNAFLRDLWWGVRSGLLMAVAYSLLALCSFAIFSTSSSTSLTFRAIFLYPIGGIVAGAILGLLRPFLRWHFIAMLVGAVALVPAAIAVSMPLAAELELTTTEAMAGAIMTGIVLGAAIGHWYSVDSDADG